MKTIIIELINWVYHFVWILVQIFPETAFGNKLRGTVLSLFFKKSGINIQISTGVKIVHPYRFVVGDNVYLGTNSWIYCGANIVIGDETLLGANVIMVSSNHTYNPNTMSARFSLSTLEPIIISEKCWLAGSVTVLGGSNVGASTIVAAGSLVKGVLDGSMIYGGIPAKKLKENLPGN